MYDEITIDLSAILRALKKSWKKIVLFSFFCTAIGVAYVETKTPVYESISTIRIQQPSGIKNDLEGEEINSQLTNLRMNTYTEILKSRSVIEPVIADNRLEDKNGKLIPYSVYLKDFFVTEVARDTEILKLTTRDTNPVIAQKLNEEIIKHFFDRLTELSQYKQRNTRQFLEERVLVSRKDLEDAESALNAFKREKGIFTPNAKMERLSNQMRYLDELRARNALALETSKVQNDVANAQLDENTIALADNPAMRNYQLKLSELEAKRLEYLEKYTEEHPTVVEVTKSIAAVKELLNQEIQKVVNKESSSENDAYEKLLQSKFESESGLRVAKNNLEVIAQINDRYQMELEDLSDTEREFLELMRNVTLNQEIYLMLSKKLEEARVAEVSISNEVQIVDNPTLPDNPSEPKKSRIIPLAALVGLILSCLAVIISELSNSTIRKADDIRDLMKLPVLGEIPLSKELKTGNRG